MNRRQAVLSLGLGLGAASPAWAQATAGITLEGVTLPGEMMQGAQRLLLNGAGVRYRVMFRIYVMGLYLPERSSRHDVALRLETPKRLVMVLLRNASADEFAKTFSRVMSDNAPRENLSRLIPDILRLGQGFSEVREFKKGDSVWIDYTPKGGVQFFVRERRISEPFTDPLFVTLLFQVWLGVPRSIDGELTKALLGQPSVANNTAATGQN